jgi:hypothetical protein
MPPKSSSSSAASHSKRSRRKKENEDNNLSSAPPEITRVPTSLQLTTKASISAIEDQTNSALSLSGQPSKVGFVASPSSSSSCVILSWSTLLKSLTGLSSLSRLPVSILPIIVDYSRMNQAMVISVNTSDNYALIFDDNIKSSSSSSSIPSSHDNDGSGIIEWRVFPELKPVRNASLLSSSRERSFYLFDRSTTDASPLTACHLSPSSLSSDDRNKVHNDGERLLSSSAPSLSSLITQQKIGASARGSRPTSHLLVHVDSAINGSSYIMAISLFHDIPSWCPNGPPKYTNYHALLDLSSNKGWAKIPLFGSTKSTIAKKRPNLAVVYDGDIFCWGTLSINWGDNACYAILPSSLSSTIPTLSSTLKNQRRSTGKSHLRNHSHQRHDSDTDSDTDPNDNDIDVTDDERDQKRVTTPTSSSSPIVGAMSKVKYGWRPITIPPFCMNGPPMTQDDAHWSHAISLSSSSCGGVLLLSIFNYHRASLVSCIYDPLNNTYRLLHWRIPFTLAFVGTSPSAPNDRHRVAEACQIAYLNGHLVLVGSEGKDRVNNCYLLNLESLLTKSKVGIRQLPDKVAINQWRCMPNAVPGSYCATSCVISI